MTHISTLENMAEQLGHVGDPVSLTRLLAKIMYTLPKPLRGFFSSWELIPEDQKTVQTLTAKILNEQTNQQLMPNTSSDSALAYFAPSCRGKGHSSNGRGGFNNRGGSNGRGGTNSTTRAETSPPLDKRPRLRCEHCFNTTGRELNHPTVECNRLKRKILDDAQTQTTGRRDAANAATATITNPRIDFGYPALFGNANRHDASVWIADNGATKHVTDQKSVLNNYVNVPVGSWIIEGIRGATATVHGYGDVLFEAKIAGTLRTGLIRKVLYVPDIGVNLISIGTVTALGAKVVYSGCDVTFSRNGVVDITGRRIEDGVYKLHLKAKPIETDQALVSKIVGVPLSVWHTRFAHVNMKTIQKMEQLQLVDGLAISNHDTSCICEGCIYGKMCRSPFVESKREAREVGELIVTDIQGPMQVPSLNQALYFLLIKDHGSGYRKCHFLKNKSEAADLILQFIPLFETETKKKSSTHQVRQRRRIRRKRIQVPTHRFWSCPRIYSFLLSPTKRSRRERQSNDHGGLPKFNVWQKSPRNVFFPSSPLGRGHGSCSIYAKPNSLSYWYSHTISEVSQS